MAINGKRNRQAGHKWERDCLTLVRHIYPHAVSARAANRMRDAQGIDLVNSDESDYGRMKDDIQCKCVTGGVSYIQILSTMADHPKRRKVVFHQSTKKSAGGKFMVQGTYALTTMDNYISLMGDSHKLTILKEAFSKCLSNEAGGNSNMLSSFSEDAQNEILEILKG